MFPGEEMESSSGNLQGRASHGLNWIHRPGVALLLVAFHGALAGTAVTSGSCPDTGMIGSEVAVAESGSQPSSPWLAESGEGYRTAVQTFSLEGGVAYGPAMMGSQEQHHLALLSVAYGHMFASVMGEEHWWRGNFEIRFELFGGVQFAPDLDWLAGVTPHVRYNFATGSRWTPFVDGGVGFSLTGIGSPDLGSLFEFNLQGSVGVHYHMRDELALTFETRYMHLSSAGISDQNHGLNAVIAMFGVTRFF